VSVKAPEHDKWDL